jgi:hypothetical protein
MVAASRRVSASLTRKALPRAFLGMGLFVAPMPVSDQARVPVLSSLTKSGVFRRARLQWSGALLRLFPDEVTRGGRAS